MAKKERAVNADLLKSYCLQKGVTFGDIADCLGVNATTLSEKITYGRFGIDEVKSIRDLLELKPNTVYSIFFGN